MMGKGIQYCRSEYINFCYLASQRNWIFLVCCPLASPPFACVCVLGLVFMEVDSTYMCRWVCFINSCHFLLQFKVKTLLTYIFWHQFIDIDRWTYIAGSCSYSWNKLKFRSKSCWCETCSWMAMGFGPIQIWRNFCQARDWLGNPAMANRRGLQHATPWTVLVSMFL